MKSLSKKTFLVLAQFSSCFQGLKKKCHNKHL